MKYSYSAQIGSGGLNDVHYRIQDAQDNRVATCYVEENARLVVDRMNKGELAPHLAFALDRLLNTPFAANKAAEVRQEAVQAMAEWEQLTKTPPGTE